MVFFYDSKRPIKWGEAGAVKILEGQEWSSAAVQAPEIRLMYLWEQAEERSSRKLVVLKDYKEIRSDSKRRRICVRDLTKVAAPFQGARRPSVVQ